MDNFLNFYTKYPWVAIIIVLQSVATAFILIYAEDINASKVMGMAFFATVCFAYFGFKIPKA